ncbi:hypothetical protein ACFV4K_11905 [Nocardia sp. NPDC059764]|uniref:hypothetical protein n=1 Tax=Nocardia sp. NPDC059764 TaxID=3346939 RepID=UPI003655B3C3
MNPATPTRILGAATAAYGLAVALRPEILLRPTGLGTGLESEPRAAARLIALRDLASGLAMVVTSDPRARRTAIAVRVASDAADTLVFAHALRGQPERVKTLAVTSGWGVLCAAGALHEWRRGRGQRHRIAAHDAVRT